MQPALFLQPEFCSPPKAIQNGIALREGYVAVGAYAHYKCHLHHAFPDGRQSTFALCLPNGQYSKEVEDCEGQFETNVSNIYLIIDEDFAFKCSARANFSL